MVDVGDLNIRSESGVVINSPPVQNVEKTNSGPIVLRADTACFSVDAHCFAYHSEKIQKLQSIGKLPAALDLTCYNASVVRWLAEFLCSESEAPVPLDVRPLVELMELARILGIPRLTSRIHETVIANLRKGGVTSLLLAVNLAAADWTFFLGTQVAGITLQMAVEKFNLLSMQQIFNALPFSFLVILLSRCELPVQSEMEMCELIIGWLLARKSATEFEAEQLFLCVRTQFLLEADRRKVARMAAKLPFKCAMAVERTVNSERCQRCCVIEPHVKSRFPRCGIPVNEAFAPVKPVHISYRPFAFDASAVSRPATHRPPQPKTPQTKDSSVKCYPCSNVSTAVRIRTFGRSGTSSLASSPSSSANTASTKSFDL